MDGEEQGEGKEGTNMYTHYNGTHNNVCTKPLSGSEGSAGGLYIMHSAIGPGGWGQRPRTCVTSVVCVTM